MDYTREEDNKKKASKLTRNLGESEEGAYIKSSGLSFPDDLIAFWDFSESKAPYYSKKGVAKLPLKEGITAPTSVDAWPFGRGLRFNGTSDYLVIPSEEVGPLNVALTGDEVTVIAWIYRPKEISDKNCFIAGMWQEDNNDPRRQYGLFTHLPTYGGWNRVCGHVSRYGGASPNLSFSRDYSATGATIDKGVPRLVGFTYDGHVMKSYIDGMADERIHYVEPDPPRGEGLAYAKNPYLFDLGLNRDNVSDFTVGSVRVTGYMANHFNGVLGGLAVFRRALTSEEMINLHLDSLQPSDPIQYFDFKPESNLLEEGYGSDYGWRVVREDTIYSSAPEHTNLIAASWAITQLGNVNNKPFATIASSDRTQSQHLNTTKYSVLERSGFKGLRMNQINKIEFKLNNNNSSNKLRICLKIDGQWYATKQVFADNGTGVDGSDWSTATTFHANIERKASNWLLFNYDPGISMALGNTPTNDLPNGNAEGFAILSEPIAENSRIRIADIKIY